MPAGHERWYGAQRRDSVRFPVPSLTPPVVRLALGGATKKALNLRVTDISLGGVCVVLENRRVGFGPGVTIPHCHVEIPDIDAVETDLISKINRI